ncbi:MAG: GyrI-like domain-containing protein [Bacteroidales bacterium]|nr:GyrI-like domain-containing protein [Bacteroidales bacterium]
MEKVNIKTFKVIGISVRTTNENGQSAKDIGELWNRFMTEGILDKIPNRIDNTIYSIYTDYESDHRKPYTTLVGCKVENVDTIPNGMVSKTFNVGNYIKFVSKGDLTKGAVYEEWSKIWNLDLQRTYTADFEVYGEKAQNPMDAEVDIFVAVKE